MVNKDVVNYLKEGAKRGFSHNLLKKKLLEGGFKEADIDEAIGSLGKNKKPKSISKVSNPVFPGKGKSLKTTGKINLKVEGPKKKVESEKMIGEKIGLFKKIGMSLAHPTELFEKTRHEGIGPALGFLYLILIIPLVLGSLGLVLFLKTIESLLFGGLDTFSSALFPSLLTVVLYFAIMILIIMPILLFIVVGIRHLIAKLYKGKGKYSDTFRASVYSLTPQMLFFFVPGMGIWTFILSLFGLSINHQISKWRAFLIHLTVWVLVAIIWFVLGIFLW